MIDLVISLVLGLAVGVLSGALGVGGGGVMVPFLVLLLAIDQATAQGTSLLAIIPTALSGAYGHFRQGVVNLRLCALLGATGVVGAVVGAAAALHLEHRRLREIFAVYLLFAGIQALRRAVWPRPKRA
ncbi:MAG: uncharacterized protein QOK05_96 [Chloroflexota bacterium]|jgi:uncharacterized membrane protein YfcA|nr:uncharacterized protein [Chloroflexota bacterium]